MTLEIATACTTPPPSKRGAHTTMCESASKCIKVLDTVFRPCETKCEEDASCVNTIRCICAAIVSKANSGHPGAPMGCAVVAHALFGYVMKYYGPDPEWPNRDRFVLSNGHASALLYTMLHLSGYNVSMQDLQSFRQLNSITPGHPELHQTPGVEVTTGPLGQGIANAVGLALASRIFRSRYGSDIINHHTFVILGDGCMQEGVQAEACSLAGTLKLGGLIAIYDNNSITIDGDVNLSFKDSTLDKFEAWGWKTMIVEDGNVDLPGIIECLEEAKKITDAPVLISVRTIIGFGSGRQGTAKVHGAPLASDDLSALRKACGFSENIWEISEATTKFYAERRKKLDEGYKSWQDKFVSWKKTHPELALEFDSRLRDTQNPNLVSKLLELEPSLMADAPRNTSQVVLRMIAEKMHNLVGGSADLMESNKTDAVKQMGGRQYESNPDGRYIHFGVREHGMCAIANGLAAYGGMRVFSSTFLNFYAYAWGAVRLGAMSHLPVLHIATHDSVELGEDGPTHQPIEVAALCRATPNLIFIRPGDAREVLGSYIVWIQSDKKPCMVALARGKVPLIDGTSAENVHKGGYIVSDFHGNGAKKVILASNGSELHIAVATANLLKDRGFDVRVVSFPSITLFEEQSEEYRNSIFPHDVPAALMEPYSSLGSHKYFKEPISVFLNQFGMSAPVNAIRNHLGFSPEAWADKVVQKY